MVWKGGVISPILFCIYIDDLLKRLSASGVGCCLGSNFVGALAYADDIVLVTQTPFAMRKILMICDMYASQYNIIFNAQKSKFLVICATCRRSLYASMCKCVFFIGSNPIENVDSFSHLVHITDSRFTDKKRHIIQA